MFLIDNQSDLVDKCRISLLVLKRFKGAARDQAVSSYKMRCFIYFYIVNVNYSFFLQVFYFLH